MNARAPSLAPAATGDDERSLLIRLELLLEREEDLLDAHRSDALVALSQEREQVTEQLAVAARHRRATSSTSSNDAELVALYQRLRHRHDVRARVLCLRAERNARALGVLAQANGRGNLYQSDGRVAMQFASP